MKETKVVYARLLPEEYDRLQQLVSEEALKVGKKVTLQGMVALLINRATSTPSQKPSETETEEAGVRQTFFSELGRQRQG